MAKYKIELNRAGVSELLRSNEVKNICAGRAFAAQNRLGEGYSVRYYIAPTRAVAVIRAVTPEAIADNQENNTIIKALRLGSNTILK